MKSGEPKDPNLLSRREWARIASSAGATAFVAADARKAFGASPASPDVDASARAAIRPETTLPDWTGHNARLGDYYRHAGYPAYEAHPRYLGELHGSWYEIGKQYGERAGDLIRMVYEGWYRELLPIQGSPKVMAAYLDQQNAYYETLLPEALEFMHGMAQGAAAELAASAFPAALTHFHKVLMINSYYGLKGKPPVSESARFAAPEDGAHCCSGAVIFGSATRDGKTIHVSSEDQHFFPQEYLVTYIVRPSDPRAHRYTVTDSAGEIGSEHGQNDQGVTVSGYSGGRFGILGPTLEHPFSGYRRPGLDWQVGVFCANAFANTARHAVELLTVGSPEYRAKSGREIVVGKCTLGVNWVISDAHQAFVVESIPADQKGMARYAVRVPGQMGERNNHYIVSTNNVEAPDSYREENVHDATHPMSQHGNSGQDPIHFGLSISGMRFWTFMWMIKEHFGQITPDMVKEWRKAHFIYDRAGVRHDHVDIGGKSIPLHLVPDAATLCWHTSGPPGTETFLGVDTYVSLSVAQDLTSWRTKGRPCEWVGPWDRLSLADRPDRKT